MPQPSASGPNRPLTVKQEREARRAEKVAALKKQQAREKRNRRIGIASAIVGGVAVVALVITFVVTSATPRRDPADIDIAGLETTPIADYLHTEGPVEYEQSPPVGGNHNPAWLNCGVYDQPVPNEYAVHSLEHGAVWVTYDPAEVDDAGVQQLRDALPDTYVILSPYEDLPSPVVASGWGQQVQLDGPDDERLADFVERFWRSADVPEPAAACTGAVDAPGKVS